jgi:hypothetical protein
MNYNMDKVHFKKGSYTGIHFSTKYGIFGSNQDETSQAEDGNSNCEKDTYCIMDTYYIILSLLFYIFNMFTEAQITFGSISIKESSPWLALLILDLLLGIIALCLIVYSSKRALKTSQFQFSLIFKSVNFLLILALIICTIVSFACEMLYLSLIASLVSLIAVPLFLFLGMIYFLLHVCKHRKNTNRKMTEE